MVQTVIPLDELRSVLRRVSAGPIFATDAAFDAAPLAAPADIMGRALRDLRISVTDRCNFRCGYCMPREVFGTSHRFLPQSALLSFEEIARVAGSFVRIGVRKIRLTGGEPLLRKHLETLVAQLSALRTPEGDPLDLTLTTNGSLLAKKARALKDAGLQRVTVSLDALDDAIFRRMNDADFPVRDVLAGIDAAIDAGLGPVKVNMVVQRGVNDNQILPMARHFKGTPVTLRFIEYMDVGATNGWRLDEVLPSAQVIECIDAALPIERVRPDVLGETAQRWRYRDGGGEIGVISSVTHAFCGDCNRARLSTEGRLFLCLFAHAGHDVRSLLRGGTTDAQLERALTGIWQQRSDRYSQLRETAAAQQNAARPATTETDPDRRVEMHYIGG